LKKSSSNCHILISPSVINHSKMSTYNCSTLTYYSRYFNDFISLLLMCERYYHLTSSRIIFYCSLYLFDPYKGSKVVTLRHNLSTYFLCIILLCHFPPYDLLSFHFLSWLVVRYHLQNSITISFIQSIHCAISLFIFHFVEFI